MIDLKEYIKESLLDDFETLNKNVDDVLKKPFKQFLINIEAGTDMDTENWDNQIMALQQRIESLSTKYKNIPKSIKKGEAYITFFKSKYSRGIKTGLHTSFLIKFSPEDASKYGSYCPPGCDYINIGMHGAHRNVVTRSFADKTALESDYKGVWYRINKDFFQDALEMLKAFASRSTLLKYKSE